MGQTEELATKATSALSKRAGAAQFQVSYNGIASSTKWFASATFPSGNVVQGEGSSVAIACDRLAIKLLDGAVCGRCKHVIAVTGNDPTYCQWRRRYDVWFPGCGQSIDSDIELKASH